MGKGGKGGKGMMGMDDYDGKGKGKKSYMVRPIEFIH
jgi:hypothetical protein